jgi:hypothetical protein
MIVLGGQARMAIDCRASSLMNNAFDASTDRLPDGRRTLTPPKAATILWDCAWEALILAFLVQLFGNIAVRMVGNVWSRMTPSLPPGLASELGVKSDASPTFSFSSRDRLALIFVLLFVGLAAGRLMRYSRNQERRNAAAWLTRITRRVSAEWFGIVVINAIIASVMVPVLQITSQFTLTKVLWNLLGGLVQPVIQAAAGFLPDGPVAVIKGLANWVSANQLKFSFWLLYSAAICDDLGLPNYKTLGRSLSRRFKRSGQPVTAATPPA